jgi:hypothetical protein
MAKRTVKLLFFFIATALSIQAQALSFGSFESYRDYTPVAGLQEMEGQLNILAYQFNGHFHSGEIYEVRVEASKIALVEQNRGFGEKTEMNFLSVNLPVGKYSVSLARIGLFGSEIASFEVFIRSGRSISLLFEDAGYRRNRAWVSVSGIPRQVGRVRTIASGVIDKDGMQKVIATAQSRVAEYLTLESNASKLIAEQEVKLEEARQAMQAAANEKAKAANALKEAAREVEANLTKLESEKKAVIELAAKQKEDDEKKAAAEALAKQDDATCKSFGAKHATQPYIACRATILAARYDAEEREKQTRMITSKIEDLKSEIANQDRDRAAMERDRKQAVEKSQHAQNQAMLNQLEAQRDQREAAEKSRRVERALAAMAGIGQPTPITQVAPTQNVPGMQIFNINGRQIRCSQIGLFTNCN